MHADEGWKLAKERVDGDELGAHLVVEETHGGERQVA